MKQKRVTEVYQHDNDPDNHPKNSRIVAICNCTRRVFLAIASVLRNARKEERRGRYAKEPLQDRYDFGIG